MLPSIRTLLGLLASVALAPGGAAQAPSTAAFDAATDVATRRAADSLELSESQRSVFFENVETAVADVTAASPDGGRRVVDSALALVVRETGRKMRFVRQARVIFSDMFARRANDRDRPSGTEEELWRSPVNVAVLIELYRNNPDASDFEMERAMAVAFKPVRD